MSTGDQSTPRSLLLAVLRLDRGGSERRCIRLANELCSRGLSVAILTLRDAGPLAGELLSGVRLEQLGCGRLASPSTWWRYARAVRRLGPSLYMGFGTFPGFAGAVLARQAGVPTVVNALVTTPTHYPRWYGLLGRLCFLFAHHAVANSRGVRDYHVRHWGFPASKVTVIPNPIDTAAWPCRDGAVRAEVRGELGLREEQLAIGVVARLFWYKGHRYLLDAFGQVADRHPNAVLLLIGDGPLQAELERQAEHLGIHQQVRFLGLRQDVPRLLQGCDLLCLPSVLEGMPNAVLEAMAAGLPVVSTAVSGADELVAPGETGWLVPIEDASALAAALDDALSNRERLAAYGLAGRRKAEAEFDLPIVVEQYLELFARLTGERRDG